MMSNKQVWPEFYALAEWATAARRASADSPPDVSKLCFIQPAATKFVLSAEPIEYCCRTVIAFEVDGGKRIGVRKRHLLPSHFAILRLLELIPGLTLLLRDDQHRNQDVKTGRVRSEREMIFNLAIKISPRKAKRLRILQATKLDRILLDVDSQTRLYERRNGDYRYILPASFVPIRFRGAPLHTQPDVVRAVFTLLNDHPSFRQIAKDVAHLLEELFAIANDWHWDELIDRVPTDIKSASAIDGAGLNVG